MPFDYTVQMPRLTELIEGAAAPGGAFLLHHCVAAGHRTHFFVPGGTALRRRGQTIFKCIEDNALLPARGKPGKPQWQAFCEGRPLSLSGILKIDAALVAFANHHDEAVRAQTLVDGQPFTMQANAIVPSVYWVDPEDFLNYRTTVCRVSREKLSVEIFGHGQHNTLTLIERGENGQQARVTRATLDRMKDVMGDGIGAFFAPDHTKGIRRGENTFALEAGRGNLLAYVRQPEAAIA
jgi:hypothetical protein